MTKEEQKEAYGLMKNDELIEIIEAKDLKVEAKNPNKPNKTELIETLMKQKAKEDYINGVDEDEEDEIKPEAKPEAKVAETKIDTPTVAPRKLTRSQKARIKFAELSIKERVLVHDTMTSQTKDEVRFVSWGNRFMGYHKDVVSVTGKIPQYVRKGALDVLKDVQLQEYFQAEPDSPITLSTRKRYTIVPLDGITEEEIAVLATQQNLRNAKFA